MNLTLVITLISKIRAKISLCLFKALRVDIIGTYLLDSSSHETRRNCILIGWYRLRKRYPYLELFWSLFSRIRTEYGEIQSISMYSVQTRENTDQNNSEYGHFLRSDRIFFFNKIFQNLFTFNHVKIKSERATRVFYHFWLNV